MGWGGVGWGVGSGGGEEERQQLLPWLLRSCYVVACLRALLIRFSTADQCRVCRQARPGSPRVCTTSAAFGKHTTCFIYFDLDSWMVQKFNHNNKLIEKKTDSWI